VGVGCNLHVLQQFPRLADGPELQIGSTQVDSYGKTFHAIGLGKAYIPVF
jgi:hypothetical protein